MKLIHIVLIVLALFLLTACYDERGYAYKHLNEYEPGHVQQGYTGNDSVLRNTSTDGVGGVYESLQDHGCDLHPHCCGEFTSEEKYYYDLHQRALVENNIEICSALPDDDLVVDCPYEEPYTYYSKSDCVRELRK